MGAIPSVKSPSFLAPDSIFPIFVYVIIKETCIFLLKNASQAMSNSPPLGGNPTINPPVKPPLLPGSGVVGLNIDRRISVVHGLLEYIVS